MHELGLADPELVQDHERDRFAGTSAGREDDPSAETSTAKAPSRSSGPRWKPCP